MSTMAKVIVPEYITKQELIKKLRELSNRYASENQWEYDQLASLALRAQIAVCEDLAQLLGETDEQD